MAAASTEMRVWGITSICALAATAVQAQDLEFASDTRVTQGDWVVECLNTAAEPQPTDCQLYQRVLTQNPSEAALVAAFAWSPNEEAIRVQMALPLGVDLQRPPVLRIDGEEVSSLGWTRCTREGCMIDAVLNDAFVRLLSGGVQASVTIGQFGGGELAIPLSLIGFEEALVSIRPEQDDTDAEAPTGN